jgi:hypothetical protein
MEKAALLHLERKVLRPHPEEERRHLAVVVDRAWD